LIPAYVCIGLLLAGLVLFAQRRGDARHGEVVAMGWRQMRPLLVRLPAALLATGFLAELLPETWFAQVLGGSSGIPGILLAGLLGGLLPGGPIVSFPIALVLLDAGVGIPQMVALLTGWSVLALHRVLAFELPMMGWGFVWRRWVASLALAPAAGLLAQGWLALG
jgi:hypothetical protein